MQQHLNARLKTIKGWTRTLLSVNKKGELNEVTLNGDEVQALITDLLKGADSVVLSAVRTTAQHMNIEEEHMHNAEWEDVLYHWAVMMNAGYKYHATAQDHDTFAKHARLYVLRKVCISEDNLVW